jgi:DNA replication factor Dna2
MKHDAYLTDSRTTSTIRARLALTDLLDVEENIWSPTYGLKGVVDASMQAHIVEEDGLKRTEHSLTLPLEIKTGRREGNAAHRAQTMLYTLLMSERYGNYATSRRLSHIGLIARPSSRCGGVLGVVVLHAIRGSHSGPCFPKRVKGSDTGS